MSGSRGLIMGLMSSSVSSVKDPISRKSVDRQSEVHQASHPTYSCLRYVRDIRSLGTCRYNIRKPKSFYLAWILSI